MREAQTDCSNMKGVVGWKRKQLEKLQKIILEKQFGKTGQRRW